MYSLKNATCQFRVAWHLTSGYFCQWCTFYQTKYSLLARSDTKHWKWNHYVNLTCLSLKKWPLLFLDMTYHLSGVHLNIFLAVELLWRQLFLTAIELKQWFFLIGRARLSALFCYLSKTFLTFDLITVCVVPVGSEALLPDHSLPAQVSAAIFFHGSWLFKMFSGVTTSVATSQNISPLSKNVSLLLVLHYKCYSFASFSTYSISLQHHK